MTEEELRKEATFTIEWGCTPMIDRPLFVHAYITGAFPREKRIEELEEKISVLLSCKDCPENKDGLICQKEYENKCLAQKIQFIKELQQENAELRDDNKVMADNYSKMEQKFYDNLTEAKEIIEELYNIIPASMADYAKEPMEHARKFMTEE